jgi:hypothetical protein
MLRDLYGLLCGNVRLLRLGRDLLSLGSSRVEVDLGRKQGGLRKR